MGKKIHKHYFHTGTEIENNKSVTCDRWVILRNCEEKDLVKDDQLIMNQY